MILRLIVSHPPLWHPFLAAALMAVTIVLVMRLSARLFHAQTLMTGQRFTPKAFYKAITGR
jgi:ABC-type Na+ efflux pump permease subunit